jgi:hypothetical protein
MIYTCSSFNKKIPIVLLFHYSRHIMIGTFLRVASV